MNKVIIAGSRTIKDYDLVAKIIKDSGFVIDEVVSGCAAGVDFLGERYGEENNIPIKKFPADWSLGKIAGVIRNHQMRDYATHLIAISENNSKGTAHMIRAAREKGLITYVRYI